MWNDVKRLAAVAGLVLVLAANGHAAGGSLDPDFGAAGVATLGTDADGARLAAQGIALQSDGRIVVAGTHVTSGNTRWGVRRYLPDGSRDMSFGTNGRVVLFGTVRGDVAWDVAVGPDDRIYVGGIVSRAVTVKKSTTYEWNHGAARLNADGSLDTTWGTGGTRVVTTLNDGMGQRTRIRRQSDGKVLLVGRHRTDLGIARLSAAGALDTSYGTGGTQIYTGLRGFTDLRGAAVDSADRLLVATFKPGSGGGTSGSTSSLARFTASGALDTSFPVRNLTGDFAFASTEWVAHGLVVQADDKPVLSARIVQGGAYDCAVVRYTASGSVDTTFGSGGMGLGGGPAGSVRSLALSPGGTVTVIAFDGTPTQVSLFRFLGDGTLDSGYGTGGRSDAVVGVNATEPLVVDGTGAAVLATSGNPGALVRYLGQ